jgi:hypothetical protein
MTSKAIVKITHAHSPKYRDGETLYLLRLHDGGPADAGADVYHAVTLARRHCYHYSTDQAIPAINHLLTRCTPPAPGSVRPFQLYRPVDTPPPDIRYFYEIDCPPGYVFLNYAAGLGPQLETAVNPMVLNLFRDHVNDCRQAINDSIQNLATLDPIVALQSPYPFIA